MAVVISNEEKKKFIKDFLHEFSMKSRECIWILNYIADGHDHLLENVHFVDDITGHDNVLIMATQCSTKQPFKFKYNEGSETNSAEKAFHHLRLNTDEQYYIKFETGSSLFNIMSYASVLEDNSNVKIPKKDSNEVDKLFTKLLFDRQVNSLKAKIDEALDNNDKEAFMIYSEELKKQFTKSRK